MCDECAWHHKTLLLQLYWHLAIKLYCTYIHIPKYTRFNSFFITIIIARLKNTWKTDMDIYLRCALSALKPLKTLHCFEKWAFSIKMEPRRIVQKVLVQLTITWASRRQWQSRQLINSHLPSPLLATLLTVLSVGVRSAESYRKANGWSRGVDHSRRQPASQPDLSSYATDTIGDSDSF